MRRSKPVCVCLFFYRFPMIKRELLRVFPGGSLKSVRRPMPTFFANQNPQKKHNEKVANPATFPANCELRTANCELRTAMGENRKPRAEKKSDRMLLRLPLQHWCPDVVGRDSASGQSAVCGCMCGCSPHGGWAQQLEDELAMRTS